MKTLMVFALVFLLFSPPSVSKAQNSAIRQLEAQYNAERTPERALELGKVYQERASWFQYTPQFNFDSVVFYFDKAIILFENTTPIPYEPLAEAHLRKSQFYYSATLYNKAILEAVKSHDNFENHDNRGKQNKMLHYEILANRAFVEVAVENPKKGLELLFQAIALLQDDTKPEIQALILKDKCRFYSRYNGSLGNRISESTHYAKQSMRLYESLNNPKHDSALFTVYGILTWGYNVTLQNDSCDYYCAKMAALLPKLKNPLQSCYYYSTKGNNLFRRKQYNEAATLIQECLKIAETYQLKYTRFYTFSLDVMGAILQKQGHYDRAIAYFEKSRDLNEEINGKGAQSAFAELMSQLYEDKGDYEKALKYYKTYSDSVISYIERNSSENIRKSELQLNVLNQEKELNKKRIQQSIFIAALVIGALLLGFLYRNYRSKQRINLQLETLNRDLENKNKLLDKRNVENELLLKEIHHRVKNNLEVVSSLLALQSAQINDPSVQDAMQSSQNRVQSMGILHQKLYQSEHLAFIEMKNYFMNLSENILDSYNASDRVTIDCAMNEIDLDVDTAVPIGLIVNELLTNSLKYAFTKGQMGTVRLSLVDLGQDILQLKIADNGIGKSLTDEPQGTGFGTQLVDLLTKQLDGTIHQEINNGTIISIHFKRAKAA